MSEQQPSPQVFVNAPGDNGASLAMAAHTVSITNAAEMRLHREECNKRDERNENMFKEIRSAYETVVKDLNGLKVKLAFIVGGIMAVSKLFDLGLSIFKHNQ